MQIALIHDDFSQRGGAENLFAQIAQIYPKAPIYTALYNKEALPEGLSSERITASWMQKIPLASKFFKLLLPLYPLAFESFNFGKYDLVISSTTRFAKGVITKPKTIHACYINSTPRFLWHEKSKSQYLKNWQKKITDPMLAWLKRYDKAASARVDFYIANSQNVAAKVKKDYGRDAAVVYPYADCDFFTPKTINSNTGSLGVQQYYLVVTRLVKWKKIDIAIKACKSLGKKLIIVGTGPDQARLKKLSNNNIQFQGLVSPEKLRELYQNAQALIVTQEEDFGISAVEANACGIPVIAYKLGGQTEIIIDGTTGLFYQSQTPKSLEDAILHSSKVKWTVSACRNNSLRFTREIFVKEFLKAIADIKN